MEWILFALRIAVALGLYAFLGVVVWVILREPAQIQQTVISSASIAVLEGDQAAQRFELRSPAWIGRDPNALICLRDNMASQRHAQIFYSPAEHSWVLEDNASRNGTFLNGARVARSALTRGDLLRIGDVEMRFEG